MPDSSKPVVPSTFAGKLLLAKQALANEGRYFVHLLKHSRDASSMIQLQERAGRGVVDNAKSAAIASLQDAVGACAKLQSDRVALSQLQVKTLSTARVRQAVQQAALYFKLRSAFQRAGAIALGDPQCRSVCAEYWMENAALMARRTEAESFAAGASRRRVAFEKQLGINLRMSCAAAAVIVASAMLFMHWHRPNAVALAVTSTLPMNSATAAVAGSAPANVPPDSGPQSQGVANATATASKNVATRGTTDGHRFPDKVEELLSAAKDIELLDNQKTAGDVPEEMPVRLFFSPDPFVQHLMLVESHLIAECSKFNDAEMATRLGGVKALMDPAPTLTHTVDRVEHVGNATDGQMVRVQEQEADTNQPLIDAETQKHQAELDAYYELRFQLFTDFQELAGVLEQIANRPGPGKPATDSIFAGFSDSPDQQGTVIIRNKSAQPMHHCLMIVKGYQNPPVQTGDAMTRIVLGLGENFLGLSGGPHQDAEQAMPSVSISYRDQLAPGEEVSFCSCMSNDPVRLKSTTAEFWSDESVSGPMPITDREEAFKRMNARIKAGR